MRCSLPFHDSWFQQRKHVCIQAHHRVLDRKWQGWMFHTRVLPLTGCESQNICPNTHTLLSAAILRLGSGLKIRICSGLFKLNEIVYGWTLKQADDVLDP